MVGLANHQVKSLVRWENKNYAATLRAGVFIVESDDHVYEVNDGLENLSVYSLLVNIGKIYAGTRDGVFVRENETAAWQRLTDLPSETGAYSMVASGSHLFVGSRNGVLRINLTNVDDVTLLNSGFKNDETYVMSLAFVGDVLYAGTQAGLFTLTDGDIWSRETNVPAMTVGQLAFDNDMFIAPTDGGGISVRTNDSWTQRNNGLPSLKTFAAIYAHDKFYCGTDRGVYVNAVPFETWQKPVDGMPANAIVNCLVLINDELYACTENGLYRLR